MSLQIAEPESSTAIHIRFLELVGASVDDHAESHKRKINSLFSTVTQKRRAMLAAEDVLYKAVTDMEHPSTIGIHHKNLNQACLGYEQAVDMLRNYLSNNSFYRKEVVVNGLEP